MANVIQEGLTPRLQDFEGQGAVFHSIRKDLSIGHGVHAYLFAGPKGVGKRTLAALVGQGLLCTGNEKPCGHCPACQRFKGGNHPDVMVISDEKSIKVDAIRDLLRQASEHTYEGGKRIILIHHAEKMTAQAQNSLLKTLEEPNQETVFLLSCDDATQLLPTIISRCRMMRLHPWDEAYVTSALTQRGIAEQKAQQAARVSGGSIGAALNIAQDEEYWQLRQQLLSSVFALKDAGGVCQVSAQFKDAKDSANLWLATVEEMIREVMLVRVGQTDRTLLDEYPAAWQKAGEEAPIEVFHGLLQSVFKARRLKANQVNWQAVIDTLLLAITEEMKPWLL